MARDLGTATLGLASETGFPLIGGVDTGVLSFPAFAPDEGPRIVPQTAADEAALTWALGMDIYIPQPSGTFVSLVQTGDGDGELFLRDNGDGTAGIGIDGVYDGAVAFDAWTRIVVIFTQEGGVTVLRKFVDGVLVGTQDLGATDRFGVDPVRGLSLFNDNDGETAAGAVASVFYSTDVPSAAEVAGLLGLIPTPNAGGFFLEQPSQAAIEINFDDMDIAPRYGAADVFLDGFGFQTPLVINESAIALASQFGIAGPDGADIPVLDYAAYTPDEGVLVGVPPAVGDLSSYTAVWDINFDDLPGFQGLLQTDLSQDNDGELFIRSDGGIGINGDYDGTVTPGTWHRIAITVEDQGDGTATLSKYLDGAFLDDQTVDAARFTLNATTGFLLLADNDSETSTGYLSHFGLSEEVLDAGAIAALGGADGAGPFTETANTGGTPLPPTGTGTRTLVLNFDSSFRPYDEMTGEVMVSVDGGAFQSLLTLDTSTVPGGQSSLDRVNEAASLEFDVAEDATEVAFSFQLRDGGNDWWWAFDNLSLADADGNVIFAENFDGLTPDLQAAVDENIGILGWTPDAPEGWTRENALTMPQGATEWQGWSFATPEFWLSADGQNRSDFTLGTGVVAIADPDEWDDFNDGTQTGDDFDSTLTTPVITLELPSTPVNYQLGFDTYQETSEFGFQVVDVIDEAPVEAIQDNIKDLLISDDGTPTVIDLAAAFGAEATDFALAAADGTVVDAQIDGTALTLSAQTFGHSDITVTALVDGETLTENFRAIVAGENAYVFAVIPDTQDYTSNPGIAESFGNITSWIVDQKDSLEIFHAIHVGDIVQFGAESQWLIAEEAIGRLDGEVSYTLAVGNHDQQRPGFSSAFSFETDIDAYFTPEQVGATAAQGGGTYDGFDVGPDTFANGDTYADSIRNAYSTHTAPDGTKWLIFSLEFGMPDDVLRWAGEVIEDHLDHRVIIDTHSWQGGDGRVTPTTEPLTTDNDGWGYAIRENPRAVNGGEDAWREFASKYPNITFTFNGHNFMGGAETTVSYGAGDNPVFQTFVNYQNGAWAGPEGIGPNGGNGAVRLVVVDPDNDRYTTHTKLVELDTYYNDFPDHEEVFEGVDFGAPEEIAIAKAGETMVVNGDGISATVELDGSETIGETTGAAFEWFTADGEKLGDGEALSVQLQTGTTRLTLKVTDQNGNVSTDDKVVIVQTPAVQPEDAPIVIAHRGQSADRPEHTLEAYQLAIDNGADFIEPDLVSTADGVLVARHEPWLATVATDDNGDPVLDENGDLVVTFASTDVALRPEFADRLTTKNIGFSSDGLFGAVTGWFAEDFTLAEIKTLRAVEDQPELRPQSAAFDGQFEIPTLAEVIQLVKDHEAATGEKIGIYPETKEPTYFDSIGLSLEENLVQTLIDNDFTDPDQIFIQSFEIANLLDLQENILPDAGIDLPLVQLLFNAPTFGTFDLVNEALTGGDFSAYASLGFDATSVSGDLFSVEGLQTIADVYAEGIGPSFSLIDHGDGTFSDLVDNAQDAGLLVHAYTHR
ncbi:MAG: glycerophosphodiester phosphodiesterase family protein, partial [Pseudomonadota bacterium]